MKPILALLAVAAAMPALAQAEFRGGKPIDITMTDRGYVPRRIVLNAGRSYTLRFHNSSARGHDFSAKAFLGAARVAPRDQALIQDNKVDLDPGQSAVLHIVAPNTRGARYDFHSEHLTDAASGLKGSIYVR